MTAITASDTITSRSVESVPDNGNIRRGKYTLLTRYAFPTIDMLVFVRVQLNTFHARRPAKVNRKYGVRSALRPATMPNAKLKRPAAISGCNTTHAAPSRVCL